ncbi:hypothetical protein [Streptomyces sp. NPDC059979]|uniref:hypothetical protein n=1 Tax=unclassified Streptomyces TaxID=2593676 RepID=UPI0036533F40
MALLAARQACRAAGLVDLDWIAAGLAALADGRPLPPPFDAPARVWQVLKSDPRVPDTSVGEAVPPPRPAFQPPTREGLRTPGVVVTGITGITGAAEFTTPDRPLRVCQPHMAVPALFAAAEADPLQAALDAVFAAVVTYGENYRTLLQEVWSTCQEPA